MQLNRPISVSYFQELLDAFPSIVIVVDRKLQIHAANRAAKEILEEEPNINFRPMCGEFLHCIHGDRFKGGCGTTEHCPACVIRQTTEAVLDGKRAIRQLSEMQIEKQSEVQKVWFLVTGSEFIYDRQQFAIIVLEDITELIELRRILPICSHCKKVRDDKNYWQKVEEYFHKNIKVQFSHGICPECAKEHYPDVNIYSEDTD